jgi:phage shock protein PspC (stress-responsive transcriptional regulator)
MSAPSLETESAPREPAGLSTPPPVRRDLEHGVLGGVCAGFARRLGIDPLVVRVAFVAAAAAGGAGVVLYALAWALVPASSAPAGRRPAGRPGSWRVAAGIGLLSLSALLVLRELGVWFTDALVWPIVLAAAGGALIWRQSAGRSPRAGSDSATAVAERAGDPHPAEPGRSPATAVAGAGTPAPPGAGRAAAAPSAEALASPLASARDFLAGLPRLGARALGRTGLGVALVVGAGLAFLVANGALGALRDVVLGALVVAVVLAIILAPWWWRLARSLAEERAARIRSQERAEVAAHLHDSVLQTLALVQRRADDPRAVAGLVRRQERELRTWLSGRAPSRPAERVAAALEAAAEEVEERHDVSIEVVAVGDAPLDERGETVVAAAREALVNAAKFAGDEPVSLYAELSEERLHVFVRDRGPGFDPGAVPGDRRGIRDSIVGRMEHRGGRAQIHPGDANAPGTEVELLLERRNGR